MISTREKISGHLVLIVVAGCVLFPVVWILGVALSPNVSGTLDLGDLQWGNFAAAWQEGGFGSYLVSSVAITVSVVSVGTVLAVMSGYAFGVLGVPGQKLLFPLVLLGIMLPMETIIVPLYYNFDSYGLIDSYQGIILAQIGLSVSFGTFWMRAAFRAVPRSLADSASMDGAGPWAQLWRIHLPIARPAVMTLVLLSFMWTWNDYFLSLVLVSDPAHQPLTLGLGHFSSRHLVQVNLLAAAAVLISLPIVVMYAVFQRHFIRGVLAGALKD